MIDSVLDEWNCLKQKIEEYEKREDNIKFFNQFEETYLSESTMRNIDNMKDDIRNWIKSIYRITFDNDKYYLPIAQKAEEIEMLIDLINHFEYRIDNIISNFSYIKILWKCYYYKLKELPITEQILATTNNKLLERFEYIKRLFKNKYGNCFNFTNEDIEIEHVLRNSYQLYIHKYINNIKDLHKKLIPKKIGIKSTITKDGIVVLEIPRTIVSSKKPTKLGYLIDNLFNMPDEVLNDDEWWLNLFNKELAI